MKRCPFCGGDLVSLPLVTYFPRLVCARALLRNLPWPLWHTYVPSQLT